MEKETLAQLAREFLTSGIDFDVFVDSYDLAEGEIYQLKRKVDEIETKEAQDAADQAETAIRHADNLQLFLTDVGRYELLTAAEEIELAKRIERGDKAARDRMMNSNLRLVISIAKHYRGLGVPFLDLIQEGTLGMNRAVEKFDWRLGYKFSTYATWWIRQAVQRALMNHACTIRVPVHVVERQLKLARMSRRLEVKLGREPTKEELSEATGLSMQHVEGALNAATASISLDRKIGDEEESELAGFFSDPGSPDPFEATEELLLREAIRELLDTLPLRERQVLELRFGLEGEPRTLEEVGKEIGITRERVRQLEAQALKRLAGREEALHLRNGEEVG